MKKTPQKRETKKKQKQVRKGARGQGRGVVVAKKKAFSPFFFDTLLAPVAVGELVPCAVRYNEKTCVFCLIHGNFLGRFN